MADIRIQTQVEGLQQALSDIQTLRSQLEGLAALNVSGQIGGVGGGGGGGGGGTMGGGGNAGGGASMGSAGGAAANSIPIPPATAGHNAGTQSAGPTTVPVQGQMPQQGQQFQQNQAQAGDFAQQQAMHVASSAMSSVMQTGQMFAGAGGFGQAAGMFQQAFGGNLISHGAESVMHLRDIATTLRGLSSGPGSVQQLTANATQAQQALSQLQAGPYPAPAATIAAATQNVQNAQSALNAAQAQQSLAVAQQGAAMMGIAGGVVGGIGAVVGGVAAGFMGIGAYESMSIGQEIMRDEPRREYMRTIGNRMQLGIDTKPEERALANNRAQFEQQIANLQARVAGPEGRIVNFLSGGLLDTKVRERTLEIEEKQQREETRILEIDTPTNELQRVFGGDPTAWRSYRDSMRNRSNPLWNKDAIIANQSLVKMSSEIGVGAQTMAGSLYGQRLQDIDRLTPDERAMALGAIGSASYTNLALRGGGLSGMVSGNLNAALASMDFSGIRAFGAVSAGLLGKQGSAASDAEYERIKQIQEQMVQLNYASNLSAGQRQLTQSDIGFVRAGGLGVGASTDAAIFGMLGTQASTYNPQIALLQRQIQLTAGNPLVQQQYMAELRNVQAAQLQARDTMYGFEYNVGSQYERMFGAQASSDILATQAFGNMSDRETALESALVPRQMAVNRLQTQLTRMASGAESYTEEKYRQVTTELAQAQEALLRTTIQVDKGIADLAYTVNTASRNISQGSAQISILQGGGGVSAMGDMLTAQSANRGNVQAANEEVQRLRNKGFAEDSPQMMEAKVRLSNAQVAVAQMPQQIVNMPYSARASEAVAENAFGLQILNALPGGFGLRRQMYAGQMAGLNQERSELDEQLEAARLAEGGTLSAGTMAAYNNRRRQIVGQQVGLMSEMSYGWQNRLMSQISGAPDMSAITPMLSYRAAIGSGVEMPFFGSNRTGLESSIEQAMLFGTMAGGGSPAGLAAGAFTSLPSTVGMRGSSGTSPLNGMTLQVTVNGLPGTGVIRANSGGLAMQVTQSQFSAMTSAHSSFSL
jgi:hypothetical protein